MARNIDLENTLFLGIDMGSDSCKAVLLKTGNNGNQQSYEVLAAEKSPSQGTIDRGNIVNLDALAEIILDLIEKVTDNHTGSIYTSFSLNNQSIECKVNRAKNPFSKYDRNIEEQDMHDAIRMAGNHPIGGEREYLHIIPSAFYINDNLVNDINGPVGQMGSALDAEVILVSVLKDSLKGIVNCAKKINYPCNNVCASPIATGEAVLTEKERNQGVLLIDMGAGLTSATVFENNMLQRMEIVPFGGIDISQDLSKVLNLDLTKSEEIKQKYGFVDIEYLSMYEEKEITVHHNGNYVTIPLNKIYEIVLARTYEIISMLKKNLEKSVTLQSYPIVITGGSSRILGLKFLTEKMFENNVRIAQPWNWGGPYNDYRDPSFSAVMGMCTSAIMQLEMHGWTSLTLQNKKPLGNPVNSSMKKFFGVINNKFKDFLSFGDIE